MQSLLYYTRPSEIKFEANDKIIRQMLLNKIPVHKDNYSTKLNWVLVEQRENLNSDSLLHYIISNAPNWIDLFYLFFQQIYGDPSEVKSL